MPIQAQRVFDLAGYFRKTSGKKIDYDGRYGHQCMDYANHYAMSIGKTIPRVMHAADVYYAPTPGFTKIPRGQPIKAGDIVVINRNKYSPTSGHIGVAANSAQMYSQNNDSKQGPIVLDKIDMNSLAGSLRPNGVIFENAGGDLGEFVPFEKIDPVTGQINGGKGPLDQLVDSVSKIKDILEWISKPENWLRILLFIIGLILVIISLVRLTGFDPIEVAGKVI